jgi:hypothetical protein
MRWAIGLTCLAAAWACLLAKALVPNLQLPWFGRTLPFEYLSVPFLVGALIIVLRLMRGRRDEA